MDTPRQSHPNDKYRNALFQKTPSFKDHLKKIQIGSQIFIVKGLNPVSHACSLIVHGSLNMYLWTGR